MAGTHVGSLDLSMQNALCWSEDGRIAVVCGKEIVIMICTLKFIGLTSFLMDVIPAIGALNLFFQSQEVDIAMIKKMYTLPQRRTDSKLQILPLVKLRVADFCPKHESPFPDMAIVLKDSPIQTRSLFLKRWTYNSLVYDEQISSNWCRLAWSPSSLGSDQRSLFAAITCNHCLVIMALKNYDDSPESKWTLIADLECQLMEQHRKAFIEDWNNEKSNEAKLKAALKNVSSICATEMVWSAVLEISSKQGEINRFVLLFVAMKNGDIVTWKINVPCLRIESCSIVGRQEADGENIITCLAWSPVGGYKNLGLLAVGYSDGRIMLQWHSSDVTEENSLGKRCELYVCSQIDYMPVTAMSWADSREAGLVLLSAKEQITSAYTVDVSASLDGAEAREAGVQVQVVGLCHAKLGNWLYSTGLKQVSNTVIMSSADGTVMRLAVTGSKENPEVKCLSQLPFIFEEPNWECLNASLSTNSCFCLALFKPQFEFSHLADRFRYPLHTLIPYLFPQDVHSPLAIVLSQADKSHSRAVWIHMCTVPTVDRASLEQLLDRDKDVTKPLGQFFDVLEFAHLVVCKEITSEELVVDALEQFSQYPYTSYPLGVMVARHMLTTLTEICELHGWTNKTEMSKTAHNTMTEKLLCHHARKLLMNITSCTAVSLSKDEGILRCTLKWITASSSRMELIESELLEKLTSLVGQREPDKCIFCTTDLKFTGDTTVACSNNHSFGVCCQTLSVCTSIPYLVCSSCGALALSPSILKDLPWLDGAPYCCTLCGSYMYSSHTSNKV